MSDEIFSELDAALEQGGAQAVLEALAERLRKEQRFHELFECLKMQVRHSLGLPLLYSDTGDELPDATRDALEEGLIGACRTVGSLLLQQGKIREAWTYLRAVGDKQVVQERIRELEVTDENVDQIIEVCLHDAVDLAKGFELLLAHYGTCNSITTFESTMYGRPRADRAIGAELLVRHVYNELWESVRGHIEREEKSPPTETRLADALKNRDWLTANGSYHIDVTHLSSTVRIARDAVDQQALRLARELTEYGRRLDKELQYPGESPFDDVYESHFFYFSALLGENVDQALGFFRKKAEACSPHDETTAAIEVYIDLLHRLNRTREAIDVYTKMIPTGMQTTGQAPHLLELCAAVDDFDVVRQQSRETEDVLGYTMGLLKASPHQHKAD